MQNNVCLILEGSYPYVSGGVSSCVHQLIKGLPDHRFSLVYVGTSESTKKGIQYQLPFNVLSLDHCYLFKPNQQIKRRTGFAQIDLAPLDLLRQTLLNTYDSSIGSLGWLTNQHSGIGADYWQRLLQNVGSKKLWDFMLDDYKQFCDKVPFADFTYIWHSTYLPIIRLLAYRCPQAKVYHSLCTGYAGLLAQSAALKNGGRTILTEHGLYDYERRLDIASSKWMEFDGEFVANNATIQIKRWWDRVFTNISRIAYSNFDRVVTLHEKNHAYQIKSGAPESRTEILSNGLGRRFSGIRRQLGVWEGSTGKFRIGFVGRVVPIKDIKCLIIAIDNLLHAGNNIECFIIGPTDEDPDYYLSCCEMVNTLNLQNTIHFTGPMRAEAAYQKIDCLVLTSISESQPLVILEASSAGLPVVTTDVGACEEMINGRTIEDKKLGPSGLLAQAGNPDSVSREITKLIKDPILWAQLSDNGMKRIDLHYDENYLFRRYRSLYTKLSA